MMEEELQNDIAAFNDTNQENSRKLFVGGLSWETTSDSLRAYMSRYGEVVDCSVKVDVSSGRSRGFGFVMFRTSEQAETVLRTRPHMLDGKLIDPKKAVGISKSGLPITKKIFIGGVRSETGDDALKEYFSQFGSIHALDFPIDHTSSKRRGFCFLEFDDPEAAEKAMTVSFHSIGNQTVEVKPAYTKEQQQALMARGMWPPHNLQKSGGALDIGAMESATQAALKNIIGSGVGENISQINQMAAAALFYQTYFQYAMAFGASSNVVPNVNEASSINTQTEEIYQNAENTKKSKSRSPSCKRSDSRNRERFSPPRRRSPARENERIRHRRRSSSEGIRKRRDRSPFENRRRRRR